METLRSSYEKLHGEIQALFREKWVEIKNRSVKKFPNKEKELYIIKKKLSLSKAYFKRKFEHINN